MTTPTDYHQIATKLNYAALEKKLAQLRTQTPPKMRQQVADVLAPIADKLRDLRAQGWTHTQLAKELADAGLPVKTSTLRRHLRTKSKRCSQRTAAVSSSSPGPVPPK